MDEGTSPPTPQVDASQSQIGVIGNQPHIEGGIHFHAAASPPPLSLHHPARVEHFTNREQELAQLLADLKPGRVVTLCGSGGIGKSALAAEALWRLAPGDQPPSLFPDGIIFHSFYNQPQAALALEAIARAFGEEPRPTPRDAAQRVLSGRRALLLLDGAEDADDLPAVLSVAGSCGVLVTSRSSDDAVADWQDLPPLATAEAVVLLRAWGGAWAADEASARAICELVGGLPLAVRLVGRYLARRKQQAATYLKWLQTSPLQALNQGEHREQSIPLLLERSLAQVSEAARQVLALIGLLALQPFEGAVVAAAFDWPLFEAEDRLGQLVSYGLLLRPGERYEVSHALIHTYARERLQPGTETVERLAAYYTTLAETESQNKVAGYLRLDRERAHLIRVMAGCVEAEAWEGARRLVWAIEDYLDIQGYGIERMTALEAGLTAARKLGHRQNEGAFLGNLGIAYRILGQVEKAIENYQQALLIHREIGDRRGEATQLGNLGIAYRDLGQVGKAIENYQQALLIHREIGDRRGEATQLGNLGSAYRELGQVAQAIEYYQQALLIDREIGDRRGEANQLGNLGLACYVLGQMEQAIEHHQEALLIHREIGYRRGEANQLGNLGLAFRDLGQVERGIEHFQQALLIHREIGYRQGEATDLGNLGNAYSDLEQVEQAIEYFQQALLINREISDRQGEATDLGNLGNAYSDLGQVEKAIKHYQQALLINREIGFRRGEATQLGNLGNAYRELGQIEKAIKHFQQALFIHRKIGFRQGEALTCWNLGLLYEESDPAQAVALMSVYVAYEREIGHSDAEADAERVAQIQAKLKLTS